MEISKEFLLAKKAEVQGELGQAMARLQGALIILDMLIEALDVPVFEQDEIQFAQEGDDASSDSES